jgi:hypothetical protein
VPNSDVTISAAPLDVAILQCRPLQISIVYHVANDSWKFEEADEANVSSKKIHHALSMMIELQHFNLQLEDGST